MSGEMDHIPSGLVSFINWTTGLFMAGIIILYLGLIGLGQWQADEYADFALFRSKGWHFFWERMQWSPRPVSEFLLMIYGWIVNLLHRPVIVPFLAVLWVGFLAAGLSTFLQIRSQRSRHENRLCLIATLTLMALFLTAGGLTEVFYWPVGAVAYLPTLAATLLLFWQTIEGRLATAGGRTLALFALTLAALSSELGAMFAISFALVQVLKARIQPLDSDQQEAGISWWGIPGLLSLAVLFVVLANRFHQPEPGFTLPNSTVGRPLLSGAVAIRELGVEILGHLRWQRAIRLGPNLLSELLLCLGAGLCWSFSRAKPDPRATGGVIAAFLVACWLSLTSSYLHFGTAGGQRHEMLRHCWILMSFAALGVLLARSMSERLPWLYAKRQFVAPLVLLLSVVPLWHVREVLREYSAYPAIARAIHENFQSGFDPTTGQMVHLVPAHRGVLEFAQIEPGVYLRNPASATYPEYVLRFFDKRTLIVRKQVIP